MLLSAALLTYHATSPHNGSLQVWEDVVQVPLETFALQLLPQLPLLGQVAHIQPLVYEVIPVAIEEVLVLIEPDLSHPHQVPFHCLHAVFGEGVWVVISEDVAHSGTGNNFDFTTTHPDLVMSQ